MRYQIDNPVHAGGITFRAISQITGDARIGKRSIAGSRNKRLVALLVDGPNGKVALDSVGRRLERHMLQEYRKHLPAIDPDFG